jgi:rod shape-determining protein MreD
MYRNILKFIVIFLAVLLQAYFFPNLSGLGIFPDVALIIILFWTVSSGFEGSWKWAALAGLLADLAYFWPIGAGIFSFTASAYLANSLAKRFLVQQTFFRFLTLSGIIAAGTLSSEILAQSIIRLAGGGFADLRPMDSIFSALAKMAYNLAIFALLYAPLAKLKKFFESGAASFKTIG